MKEETPSWVRTSAVKIYYDETGHLPRLKKQLNAPKSSTMYGVGWMSEEDVRQYMQMRNFASMEELKNRGFDTYLSGEEQYKKIGTLSQTAEERQYYTGEKVVDMTGLSEDPRKGDLTAKLGLRKADYTDEKEDQKTPGVGKMGKMGGLGIVCFAVIAALGYLLIGGKK